ncbi:hypothetical protein GGR51DRAFT_86133 [Nemania sp. FL0031]|nr:hypothetical protein GGR51DRAFT_86133 [Nemania sp. FL0031]
MVVVIAGGVSADKGVVFKSAEAIENAYKTKQLISDKTGTLTEGKMSVVVERYCVEDQHAVASTALGLLTNINHPVSMAVAAYLKERDVTPYYISDVKVLTGKGAHLRAGNSRWLAVTGHPSVRTILADGLTAFCITIDSELRAVFGLKDQLCDDSAFVRISRHTSLGTPPGETRPL